MILTGTAEQVKAYCKNLIDVAGKGRRLHHGLWNLHG